jgi:hypothetical protein
VVDQPGRSNAEVLWANTSRSRSVAVQRYRGLVFYVDARYLLIPVLFFVVDGAIGNATSHTLWSLTAREYRLGLVTAQAYWVVGPFVLYQLIGSVGVTVVTCIVLGVTLSVTVAAFTARVPVHR